MKLASERQAVIRTGRLVLRPLVRADAERLAALGGDWEIARMTSRMPYPYTQEAALQWIEDLGEGEFIAGIELGGELIGVTGYMPEPGGLSAEIGYWIGRDWWGQGYATEAARALIDHCFQRHRFAKLTCGHFHDNPASARVIEKLGFVPSGAGICWCEARRQEIEAMRYELRRPQPLWRRLPWQRRAA